MLANYEFPVDVHVYRLLFRWQGDMHGMPWQILAADLPCRLVRDNSNGVGEDGPSIVWCISGPLPPEITGLLVVKVLKLPVKRKSLLFGSCHGTEKSTSC